MKFEILTIFPDFFRGPLDYGIVRRARETGLIEIAIHDLRAFTHDRHRTVDDRPFGGGEGMVLKPEPIFECLEAMQRCAARRDGCGRRCARDGGAAFAAGAVVYAERRAGVGQPRAGGTDLRPLRRRGRTGERVPGGSREFPLATSC